MLPDYQNELDAYDKMLSHFTNEVLQIGQHEPNAELSAVYVCVNDDEENLLQLFLELTTGHIFCCSFPKALLEHQGFSCSRIEKEVWFLCSFQLFLFQ